MLQIGVEHDDGLAARRAQARQQRGLVAEVTRETKDLEMLFGFGRVHRCLEGPVVGAVVDEDDFEARRRLARRGANAFQQLEDIGRLVESRNHNRNLR